MAAQKAPEALYSPVQRTPAEETFVRVPSGELCLPAALLPACSAGPDTLLPCAVAIKTLQSPVLAPCKRLRPGLLRYNLTCSHLWRSW